MVRFIKNILSSNKSDSTKPKVKKQKGYFLELDDSATAETANGSKPAETPKAEPAPVAKTSPTKAPETLTVTEPATAETKPEPAAAETKPAKTKTSIKKAKPAPAAKPEPAPAPTPAPVAATKEKSQPEAETTFAPKYLAPTVTNGRRRPGANMSSYLDMARQVKTPNQ